MNQLDVLALKGTKIKIKNQDVFLTSIQFFCKGANNSQTFRFSCFSSFYSLVPSFISLREDGSIFLTSWLREKPHCKNCETGKEPHCGIKALDSGLEFIELEIFP